MSLPSVSVCFPAYNEESTVADVLMEADDLLSASGLNYEILVCNDGSTDRTAELIEEIAARLPRLRVLHHERNLGIWATFEHLYAEAGNELVFLNSTDGQWDTAILFDMLPLTSQWDVIVATRLNKHYGFGRRFISWGFNLVPRIIFGVETFDAGSVKLVRREIIEQFALVSRSVFSEAERLIRAARAGYRITAFPVQTSGRRSSAARGARLELLMGSLKDVVRVWRALRHERQEYDRTTLQSSENAES